MKQLKIRKKLYIAYNLDKQLFFMTKYSLKLEKKSFKALNG